MKKTARADYRVQRLVLKYAIEDACWAGQRGEFNPVDDTRAFSLLGSLTVNEAWIWSPSRLAAHLGITRQAVNNMIAKGQFTTIVHDTSRASFTFIVTDDDIKKAPADPEPPLDVQEEKTAAPAPEIDPCDVCRASRSSQCCKGCCAACKDQCNGMQRCSKEDSPERLRNRAFYLGVLKDAGDNGEVIDESGWKQSTIPLEETTPAGEYTIAELRNRYGFKRDEAKILHVGFDLLRYDRENKTIWLAESPMQWDNDTKTFVPNQDREEPHWYKTGKSPYKTYAEAEREVKRIMSDGATIQVNEAGHVEAGGELLKEDGFQFYRKEGDLPGFGTPRIKLGPNWCTWQKFSSREGVLQGWEQLMETDKALQG